MKTISHKVSDSLFLVRQDLDGKAPKKQVDVPVNHIAVIDCSGSMSCDLPRVRDQLKKKLPKLLREQDTMSVIWFSGRGEFGTLLEAEPVATLSDLKDFNQAVDRWLKPVGLTGFKEPLEEAAKLVERVGKKSKGSAFSLFFMSDGCDNQWPRADILKAVEKAAGGFASATFVEYGYYADRPLLTAMAEKAGGALVFSEDFDRYAPAFEASMQRKLSGAPRVEVKVHGDPVRGFAWTVWDGDLVTFGVEGGAVHVPEDTASVYYVSPSPAGTRSDSADLGAAYAALSLFSLRMVPDVVLPLLRLTGDVAFIDQFASCFGKQRYSDFMEAAKAAAFDPSRRLTKGCDPDRVPRDDAFTTLELLELLASDDGNRVLLDHELFKCGRVSRSRVDAGENLSAAEVEKLQELTVRIASERDVARLKDLQSELASLTASKAPALKFEAAEAPDGYSISNLTFNEDRPNVSILVQKKGLVDVSARVPAELKGKVPDKVGTHIFRNYAILCDGLPNVDVLPVQLTGQTLSSLRSLAEKGVIPDGAVEEKDGLALFHLRGLPVINRRMVKSVSAHDLFQKEYDLCKARAAQKVYNSVQKEHFPRVSEGVAAAHGADAAAWLKEQGITDGGFSPKTVQAESKDFYVGKELRVSIKGLSSLPSMKDVRERMAKGKLTPSAELMAEYVRGVDEFLSSDVYKKASKPDQVFKAWLDGEQEVARKKVRGLIFELARIKFSVVVGQIWFSEFESMDENTLEIQADGKAWTGKVEAAEVESKDIGKAATFKAAALGILILGGGVDDAPVRRLEAEVLALLERIDVCTERARSYIQDDSRVTDESDVQEIMDLMMKVRSLTVDVDRRLCPPSPLPGNSKRRP